ITAPVLSYDPNGGTGERYDEIHTKGDLQLSGCIFDPPQGQQFKCWAEGSADGDQYDAGDDYELTGNVTFYAIWEDEEPDLSGSLTIEGSLQYGETLTASVTDCNNIGELSYQWMRDDVAIAGADQATYTLVEADVDTLISVEVTCQGQGGSLHGSFDVTVDRADGPQAPQGVVGVACTTEDNDDGVLRGVTTSMEYKTYAGTDWLPGTGNDIEGLQAGTYEVRYRATTTHKAGQVLTLVINEYDAPASHIVTIVGGSAEPSVAAAGTTITITADEPEAGYIFDSWSSAEVTFADPNSSTTTFVMPDYDVTVVAAFDYVLYEVTVVHGSANALDACMGTTITVTADEPQEGYVFDCWTGSGVTFADPRSSVTTFDMPTQNVTVTANYRAQEAPASYIVTVVGGTADPQQAQAGATIIVTSNDPQEGFVFDGWTSEDVELAHPTRTTTTFVMPAKDVTVTANFHAQEAPVTATVNFVGGGAETVQNGSQYTLPACTIKAPEGKTFAGWLIGSQLYAAGDRITVDGNVTVTPVWSDSPADPGEGSEPAALPAKQGPSGGAIAGIIIGVLLGVGLLACGVLVLLHLKGILHLAFLDKLLKKNAGGHSEGSETDSSESSAQNEESTSEPKEEEKADEPKEEESKEE
ncbi:MAG: InlB B-repeat-containing protein, partial [Clostridia bacterium]|nr:InlB B-repeat-containing protein [Clostridia bacterium]